MTVIRAVRIKKYYVIGLIALIILAAQVYKLSVLKLEEKNITSMSYVLANKLIVVDPGHGGRDPGKIGVSGVPEKAINLEVSKRLAMVLGQMGAAVILTRDTDIDLSDDATPGWQGKKRQDLSRRADRANERNADLYISIHCNAFPSAREHGAQVFSHPESGQSKILAECIQKEMTTILGNTKRQAKQVDYYALRKTKMPAAIVEIGFVTNPEEDKLLQDPLYQSKVAWSIAAGIIKYYSGEQVEGQGETGDKSGEEALKTFKEQPGNYIPAP
ncbi:N-acetylmuramoyl-L-alanine amidase family protein [Desulforamulus aeronauticus]|uniref:N-acetylmuramoyl-L-alanine amidase n=1 Tax=Desulforamulus aeronauticus DSM 10349 TaxID=1121421 RepID=A0A1M6QIP2_9FIRM|nr:N-acetylmuramoyl-L-alanine amidase [Desulforamulus aeronauticus]SHK19887.1 N-acetylmuramoyl-L-alanine amidase [Desulforamulus aeronauticus DSM 10349]